MFRWRGPGDHCLRATEKRPELTAHALFQEPTSDAEELIKNIYDSPLYSTRAKIESFKRRSAHALRVVHEAGMQTIDTLGVSAIFYHKKT